MTGPSVSSNSEPNPTSSTLLVRIRAKDQEAWRKLVHLYSPLVYRWCQQAGLQATDAADVGQEVFRAVARTVGGFRHDRAGDSFRSWLRTITHNKLRDFARREPPGGRGAGGSAAQKRLQAFVAAEAANAGGAADQDERLIVLRRAAELVLDGCTETTRLAFWRVVVEGQAPAAVAADLGLTLNAVYLARSRLLRRIRDEFADVLDA
jgi:RNA polymerase sigma-70 factor (ECF subfamily)